MYSALIFTSALKVLTSLLTFHVHCIFDRKIAEVQSRSREQVESQGDRWVEFVQDLWDEDGLKHLWDVAMPYVNDHQFVFDPATQMYGFQSFQMEDGIEAEKPLSFVLTEEEEEDTERPASPEQPAVTEPQETPQPPSVTPKSKYRSCYYKLKPALLLTID